MSEQSYAKIHIEPVIGPEFPEKVRPLIEGASKTIEIIVFDWRWYPSNPEYSVSQFNQSILKAHKKGVKIRVISNFNETLNKLNSLQIPAIKLRSRRLLHCKVIIIDGIISIVGSHNYTQHGFNYNHEASVITNDSEVAEHFLNYFNKLWNNG